MTDSGEVVYYRLTGIKKVAEYLGVSEKTVSTWWHIHGLPLIKICGTIKASPFEIDTWIKERKRSY